VLKPNLLITTELIDNASMKKLSRRARVSLASSLASSQLSTLLPSIDAMMIFSWPKFLTRDVIGKMSKLRFIQSILAGVNHIPFRMLDRNVIVASNAGAYSGPVAEYAWGLLMSAAKRIVEHDITVREHRATLVRHGDAAEGIYMLEGKTLGILGYGGIGAAVAKMARPFGMRVLALSRRKAKVSGATLLQGRRGLERVLKESDFVVIALPLTKTTARIIDKHALSLMKEDAVLVNVARGELVDEEALFNHLKVRSGFRFATDVWWYKEGRESLETLRDLASLPNFIGTPHVSGPSGLATGRPIQDAVENTLRFLTAKTPYNVVDPTEYNG
jgi:phosphoglycerate dehydrogenase-like enzyme